MSGSDPSKPLYLLTRSNIQAANRCPEWKELRIQLRAKTTSEQLHILRKYLEFGTSDKCVHHTRWVQVYNYLNALAGRQRIVPVDAADLENDRIKVLKEK